MLYSKPLWMLMAGVMAAGCLTPVEAKAAGLEPHVVVEGGVLRAAPAEANGILRFKSIPW